MAKQGRRQYTEEFKREAVKRVEEQGRGIAEVARSLGVHRSQVGRWRGQDGAGSASSRGGELRGEEAEELKRLRAEVKQLRLEREILKKAAAFQRPRSRAEVSVHRGGEGQLPSSRAVAGPGGQCQRFLRVPRAVSKGQSERAAGHGVAGQGDS